MKANHRSKRAPRVRPVSILRTWRGAAAPDRYTDETLLYNSDGGCGAWRGVCRRWGLDDVPSDRDGHVSSRP